MGGYRIGEILQDRYEIRACLGLGRLGWVLRAFDHEGGAEVALKSLHTNLAPNEYAAAQLLSGLRGLTAIKHPNMARIHDAHREKFRLYFVRQLLDGVPFSRLLAGRRARGQIFTAREAYPVIAQVASLLSDGLVHGALCPDDIWILPDQLKVTDAGLALLFPPGRLGGLLAKVPRYRGYIAPEVARGSEPDPRSDVFSLGALLGELITNVQAEGRGFTFLQQDPDLPAEIADILETAMHPWPGKRFSEPAALVACLDEVFGGAFLSGNSPGPTNASLDTEPSPPPVELLDDPRPMHSRPTSDAPDVTSQVLMEQIIEEHAIGQDQVNPVRPGGKRPIHPEKPKSHVVDAVRSASAQETTQEIEIESEFLEELPSDATSEIDISMIEEESSVLDSAVSKLEKEAQMAERKTTEEFLRRCAQLEGVDPRLLRAAHAIEAEKAGASSAQAAEILRERAERTDLGGIDPRLLRAAARLESARISSIPSRRQEEIDDPDDWREEIAHLKQEQIISFLSPPVSAKQVEVTGFPRNQRRARTSHPAPPHTPKTTPRPSSKTPPKQPK
jgi:serine/threonine protein kinase